MTGMPGFDLHRRSATGVGALCLAAASAVGARAQETPAVSFEAGYTGDFLANVSGGLRRTAQDLHLLEASATIDGERALGLPAGGALFVSVNYNTENDFSGSVTGDIQDVSSVDAPEALRLYEFWYEQAFGGDRASVKAGLLDLNADFDANETGALFLNNSHGIGPDIGQTGLNGPSIYPVTGLGVRGAVEAGESVTLRAGIYEGAPGDPDEPGRTVLDLDDDEGALLIGEAEARRGASSLKLGAWGYTAAFDALDRFTETGAPARLRESRGAYALAETCFRGGDDDDACRFGAFVRVGAADPSVNAIGRYYGAGLTVRPFASRPDDEAGFAIAVAAFGEPFKRNRAREGLRTDDAETALEWTYSFQVSESVALQPNVQWVMHPGGDPQIEDAVVVGVRISADPLGLVRAVSGRGDRVRENDPGPAAP